MTALLSARDISAGYAGTPIIRHCTLDVEQGQMVGIVGRNGAGKTTLISALSGRLPLMSGAISFKEKPIGHLPAFRRSRLGMVHVPQGREVFARLSVRENLEIADRKGGDGSRRDLAFELFPVLRDRAAQEAGTLSGGEQQMLAIGRAIVTKATLIFLDEPSLGLGPKIVDSVFESITRLRTTLAVTVVLVEQQARWIWESGMVDFVYVIEEGQIAMAGTPKSLREDVVEEKYLGGAIDAK
jgi:branched-chain amino acid transport system ATP-binding protein